MTGITALFIGLTPLTLGWGSLHMQEAVRPVIHQTISTQKVLTLTNKYRIENSLKILKEDNWLDYMAQFKVEDMVSRGTFSHLDSNGKYSNQEFSLPTGTLWGENLAEEFDSPVVEQIAWENSPEHLANIENPKFTKIGIAIKDYKVAVEFSN